MHVFKFSSRKGTKAAEMKNQIEPKKKEERSNILLELSNKNEEEYLKSYIGKKIDVLFEEKDGEFYKGHTSNYLMVKVKSLEDISNKFFTVKLENVEKLELIGTIEV